MISRMGLRLLVLAAFVVCSGLLAPTPAASAAPPSVGVTQLVSTSTTAGRAAAGNAFPETVDVSADGRYVVFASHATGLVPGVSVAAATLGQIYLRDTVSDSTVLVSGSGGVAGNGYSYDPVISDDGAQVAYISASSNLATGTALGSSQALLWSAPTGATVLASTGWELPAHGVDFPVVSVALSGSGNTLVFETMATDVLPGDPFVIPRPRLYKRTADGDITLVAYDPVLSASAPSVSDEGRFVAFTSRDDHTRLAAAGVQQVYLRDTARGTTKLVSTDAASSAAGDRDSGAPSISGDGWSVAFDSSATMLLPTAVPAGRQVYIRDLRSGTVTLESRVAAGAPTSEARRPQLSADGARLMFERWRSTLDGFDVQAVSLDVAAGTSSLVSQNLRGAAGGGQSFSPRVSADGRFAAWTTDASDLTTDTYPAAPPHSSWNAVLRALG